MEASFLNNLISQIDYLMINKKWKNCANNCKSNNSFNAICSDHRIIIADIKLSLRDNKNNHSKQELQLDSIEKRRRNQTSVYKDTDKSLFYSTK